MNRPTIQFIETMRGQVFLATEAITQEAVTGADFTPPEDRSFVERHTRAATASGTPMAWRNLIVQVSTTERSSGGGMVGKIAAGTITIDGLDTEPLTLKRGSFELLPELTPSVRRMRYQLHCHTKPRDAEQQRHFTLYGFKDVRWQPGRMRLWALWQDTTTLFVTIYEHSANVTIDLTNAQEHPPIAGTGVIYIHTLDFAKQLLTFRSSGATNMVGHITNFVRFFRFFAGTLVGVYFGSSRKIEIEQSALSS